MTTIKRKPLPPIGAQVVAYTAAMGMRVAYSDEPGWFIRVPVQRMRFGQLEEKEVYSWVTW